MTPPAGPPAGLAATAENTWVTGSNVNLNAGTTLTGARTLNSLRYTGGLATLALVGNNLETFGILNGGSGTLTISGTGGVVRQPGTAAANLYVTTGSNNIIISAPIQDHTGALTLVKSGANTGLALSGTNTFSGGVALDAGTLQLDSNTALGTGPLTIFGGALNSVTNFTNASTNPVTINADFTFSGSSSMNLGTGAISLGTAAGTARTITPTPMSSTLGGVISNGTTANALIKAGGGTLVLSGANAYTGGTTVSAGTLSARSASALGTGNVP